MFLCAIFLQSILYACPQFVEFFADPLDVLDNEGEFVEIRLDDFTAESLFVQFENKAPLKFKFPEANRFVLVHDSAYCPIANGSHKVACGLLGTISLPNSRESSWSLKASSCSDSVLLPVPRAGYSLQRVKESLEWVSTDATFGLANPYYELGIDDCGLQLYGSEIALTGCETSNIYLQIDDIFNAHNLLDTLTITKNIVLDSFLLKMNMAPNSYFWLRTHLDIDEAPSNDFLDTIIVFGEKNLAAKPIVISEIHNCPLEPEPEWVEIYNASSVSLPLSKFSFCSRGAAFSFAKNQADSIMPYESILATKDTLQLREFIGFKDVRLMQVSMGYLNNNAGSIAICMGETVIDSVVWDKHTVMCPAGFNPLTGRAENTPGFQGRSSKKNVDVPFTFKVSSRVLSKGKTPLRVYVESDIAVTLKLLDSAGRAQWKFVAPAHSNSWWNVPLSGLNKVGVAYVSLSAGRFEKLVGILLRP